VFPEARILITVREQGDMIWSAYRQYVLDGGRVRFRVAAWDASRPLVIDPVLGYSSYLGGAAVDQGFGVAIDAVGNAYVTGATASTNFPVSAVPFQRGRSALTDAFVVKVDPSTGVRIVLDVLRPDRSGPMKIALDADLAADGAEGPVPYEVLLHAAMVGDSSHFTREDSVEESWRIVQPLLDAPPPVQPYAKGSWGPPDAHKLVAHVGGWRAPWTDGEREDAAA